MVNCQGCSKALSGSWAISNSSTTYAYLGITDGYMFASGATNYVYAYCNTCYQNVTKNYGDGNLRSQNQTLTNEKASLSGQISSLTTNVNNLTNKISQLENEKTILTTERNNFKAITQTLTSDKANLTSQISSLTATNNNLTTKVAELESERSSLTTERNSLKTQNQTLTTEKTNLTNKISALNINISNSGTTINTLQNEKATLQTDLINLKKEYAVYQQNNENLTKEINSLTSLKNNLNTDLTNLKNSKNELETEKKTLNANINSYISKISNLEQIVSIQESDQLSFPKDYTQFYDIVIDVHSLKELPKGWAVLYSEEGKKRFESYSEETTCVVGVVGNFNKGKSFVLHKLSDYQIPHGYSVQTKGISLKYPMNIKKSVTLLDTAGFETPLKLEKSPGNEEQKVVEELKICEMAKDRQLTELFLQRFVIEKSNILLMVVGILTYSDQKLLNRLKSFCKNKRMFIIHNLSNFFEKSQVEEYIESTLLKTFPLKKNKYISFDDNDLERSIDKNDVYFVDSSKSTNIIHLILARDGSPAGKFFNYTTLKYLQDQIICFTQTEPFNIIENLKQHLVDCSKELMEDESRIKDLNEITTQEGLMKLEQSREILLKKCLVDELGFSRFYASTFNPNYLFYKDEKNKVLVISIDIPELEKLNIKTFIRGQYRIFTIKGEKSIKAKENVKKEQIIIFEDKKDVGNFILDLSVQVEEVDLVSNKFNHSYENGVLTIKYDLKDDKNDDEDIISFEK